jgi:hypothetical protein
MKKQRKKSEKNAKRNVRIRDLVPPKDIKGGEIVITKPIDKGSQRLP